MFSLRLRTRPAPLARPVHTRDGAVLTTIPEAKAYMLALPEGRALRNAWQYAARLVLEDASAEAITEQIELALLLECKLNVRTTQ
jgi:hypothetical protein